VSILSPTHIQVTDQCLEETKPQHNDKQYSSSVSTVKVFYILLTVNHVTILGK